VIVNMKPELAEKIMVSAETKQVLYSYKQPGERLGDVVSRLIRDRKREEFIEHLDRIARVGDFVPLDRDPEVAEMKRETSRAGKHRQKGAPVH